MNIRQEKDIAIVSSGNQQPTLNQWVMLMDELDRLNRAAVIDARSVLPSMSEIDAYLLALRAIEMPQLRFNRMAVVMAGESQPDLDFFVTSASNGGLEIESFDCIDAATAWAASRAAEMAESGSRQALHQG